MQLKNRKDRIYGLKSNTDIVGGDKKLIELSHQKRELTYFNI